MSQVNVDSLRHSSGSGSGIDLQSTGNIAVDSNTLYVDSVNGRIGINANIPNATLDINGTDGININTAPITEKYNNVSGSANSNTNVDVLLSNIHFYTSASTGNWTPNFRGNGSTTLNSLMSTNQVCLVTLISTNGGSSGYFDSLNIDGSSRTVEWLSGAAPTGRGGTDGYDVYQISIIKTGNNAFLVFGNQTYCSN